MLRVVSGMSLAALAVVALSAAPARADTVSGYLGPGDVEANGCYGDVHGVHLVAGQTYLISVTSSDFDTVVCVIDDSGPSPVVIAEDDDGGSGANSLIYPLQVSRTGSYYIVVSSYWAGDTGWYTLVIE